LRRELLIAAGPGEWRAGLLEGGVITELHVERGDIKPAGSVHLGRVVRLVGGLDAALVNIGEERQGFLPLRRPLEEGARIVVEVRREAQRDKGARLALRPGGGDAERAARLEPPAQLHPVPGVAAALALRLPEPPTRVLTDDVAVLPELRTAFPETDVAYAPQDQWPEDLDAAFEAALSPTLALPGGGTLHIAEEAAAVVMDVDTGTPEGGSFDRSAMAVNLAAATVIARQLRLRQLGGGIVVDFAALDGRQPRDRVRRAMEAALAADPTKPQVLGWSRLGHLEIVRPRRFRSLGAAVLEPQGVRKSALTYAFEALRALRREARARPAANWRLTAAPAVLAALRGPAAPALRQLEAGLGRSIAVAVTAERDSAPFDIAPL
jgi:ribonuclease G